MIKNAFINYCCNIKQNFINKTFIALFYLSNDSVA